MQPWPKTYNYKNEIIFQVFFKVLNQKNIREYSPQKSQYHILVIEKKILSSIIDFFDKIKNIIIYNRKESRNLILQKIEKCIIKEIKNAYFLANYFINELKHELKSPLHALLNMGDLLELEVKQINNPKLKSYIKKNLLFIDQIIHLIQAPHKSRLKKLRLSQLVKSAISFIQHKLDENQVKISIKIQSAKNQVPDYLTSDLIQALIILFENSIEAIKNKNIKSKMKMDNIIYLEFSIEKKHLYLKYSDSGSGIPKEYASKIFNPFFSTKKTEEQKGLGLHILKKISQKYKGKVRYDNKERCFYLSLKTI